MSELLLNLRMQKGDETDRDFARDMVVVKGVEDVWLSLDQPRVAVYEVRARLRYFEISSQA